MSGAASGAWPRGLASLTAGLLFGVGLAMSQMTDPERVLGFLDVAGDWDARLLGVLGGAVVVTVLAFPWVLRRPAPRLDTRFHLPSITAIDRPLLAGSALFGVGWGLAGYCPGPLIASLGNGNAEASWMLPALLAGATLRRWQEARQAERIDRTRQGIGQAERA